MSIAVFVTNSQDARSIIGWGARFAIADSSELIIIVPKKSKGKRNWNNIELSAEISPDLPLGAVLNQVNENLQHFLPPPPDEEGSESKGESSAVEDWDNGEPTRQLTISIREIVSPDPESDFANAIMDLDVQLLIIPAHEPTKSPSEEDNWISRLLFDAPCQTMLVRGSCLPLGQPLTVLVASDGDSDTNIALQRAEQLVVGDYQNLSLLYVRPDDDTVATEVAHFQLARLNNSVTTDLNRIAKRVVLADDLVSAVDSLADEASGNLILVGTRNQKKIRNLFRALDNNGGQRTIAAIRDGVPFSSRLLNEIRLAIRNRVPQMSREQRVMLVDRLNLNSTFDVDFIALIVLSTIIAALGLIQNSGAVVIGAMLVAPLMTPLVGIGFSLTQGNVRLFQISIRSVIFGFAVAFVVGILIGSVLSLAVVTRLLVVGIDIDNYELQARGHPNLLDWFVAFFSGVAGAYAIGRPNLSTALPGVAIAAALVPPIATSGVAFSILELELTLGALLLFITNIVAIALGTSLTFWMMGVDSRAVAQRKAGREEIAWPRYFFVVLVVLSFVVAGTMTYRNRDTGSPASVNAASQLSAETEQPHRQ